MITKLSYRSAIMGLALLILMASTVFAAKIKKKNGQVVEGEIKGTIVLKSIGQSRSKEDPKVTVYSVQYALISGNEIDVIDEKGVHKTSNRFAFFSVSQENTPPDDNEVIEIGVNMPSGPFSFGYTKKGGTVVRLGGTKYESGGTNTNTLLGEIRKNPKTGKTEIVPAIEIVTSSGTVKIPVTEIVDFKKGRQV